MIALHHFNQLSPQDAGSLLAPCVALDAWVTALVQARPYADLPALLAMAEQQAAQWGKRNWTRR